MKRVFAFGLFFLTVASITCFAQSNGGSGDVFIDQIYKQPNNSTVTRVISENDLFLKQSGYQNTAAVLQSAGSIGANLAMIQQFGGFQEVLLNQFGSNNQAKFNQLGFGNEIDVTQDGVFISTNIYQFGVKNHVLQELGRDNTNYTVIQSGYNWGVIDKGFSPNNPGYTVKQFGMVGTTITITHH